MVKLKPCPFCGNKNPQTVVDDETETKFGVCCFKRGGHISATFEERDEAEAAWNRRAQPEMRWIPCSERLPDLDEDGYSDKVLVCFSNFSGCEICEYRTDKWYVGDSDDSPEDLGVEVIAWMPLPERYREEEKHE